MTVYLDVLICLNIFVDFLLLKACDAVLRRRASFGREAAASLIGGLSSIYILVPEPNIIVELAARLLISCAVVLTASGFRSPLDFIKRLSVFYGVSFVYAGSMFAIWLIFKPRGMVINNGVVYFGISPLLLIFTAASAYGILRFINRFFISSRREKLCRIKLTFEERSVTLNALADTGHSLADMFSDSAVVIIGQDSARKLLGEQTAGELATVGAPSGEAASRFRIIPYSTVGGEGMLPAMRCDLLEIITEKEILEYKRPIAAISREKFFGSYTAIIDADLMP